MKHIVKKISCITLTVALLVGGLPVYVSAENPETQQTQPEEIPTEEGLTDEIQPEQPQPEDNSGIIPESESEMQEEEKQEELQEQTQEQVEEENQETTEIEEPGRQAPQAGARVLLEDNFQDGSGWKINQPGAVKIGSGQALIKGAGPNNAMISSGIVAAQNFLIQTDFIVGAGNTNCNAKVGFKAEDGFEQQRLQLRFDFPHNKVFLEKVTGNTVNVIYSEAEAAVSEGTHKLIVEVQKNTVTALSLIHI